MPMSFTVCWNPSATPQVTFYDALSGGTYSGTTTVTQATQFAFTAGGTQVGTNPCSDSKVVGFTLKVAPTSTDVSVQSNNAASVVFTDLYRNKSETIQMHMSLTAPNGTGYVIDGGKPVIRNDPGINPPPPVSGGTPPHSYLVGAIVVVVLLAVIAYVAFRRRSP